jgi:Asp-tRNA(Asn)/Glu-tRNA(Gln) amidotransferase C subunit
MQAVDTQGVEPMAHAQDLAQRLRADRVTESDQLANARLSRPSRRKPRPASTSCRRSSND